jgi:hypothetical protein
MHPATPAPRRRKGPPTWLIAVAVVIGLIAACAGGVAYFFLDAASEVDDIEAVVEEFLVATSNGDPAAAYSLFSSEARAGLSLATFQSQLRGNGSYTQFAALKRRGWNKSFATGRPTLFSYDGEIAYRDGTKGNVHAELVSEQGSWKIRFIQATGGPGSFR